MKKIITFLFFIFPFPFFIPCSAQIITTFAGNGIGGFSGNGGAATAAELWNPQGIAVDDSGNVYIADAFNNLIRKVNTSGIISIYAGNRAGGYSGDGGLATAAELNAPEGIAVDDHGNIYIADQLNNSIRKVNIFGIISTYAGTGYYNGSYSGDGGPATAAELNEPYGLTLDASGNVYIADTYNERIRKINTLGIIATIAGNGYITNQDGVGGYNGDGEEATAANLSKPEGVAVDGSGNVFIADFFNNRIRKVNSSGIISTFAGNGVDSYSGDGGAAIDAEISNPTGVTVDDSGVYFTDHNNIRKVNGLGIISTFAGDGVGGYSGDGGAATIAELNGPVCVSVDISGNVYITDASNSRIRKVTMPPNVSASVIANVSCNGVSNGSAIAITKGGESPYTYSWSPNGGSNSICTGLSAGTYTINVTDNYTMQDSAVITITQPSPISVTHDSLPDNGSCNGLAAVIANGGTSPYTYLWTPDGQTTDTIKRQCARTYCCNIWDNNGCSLYTCVTVKSSLGIENISNSSTIAIYPNPNNCLFSLALSNVNEKCNVEIFNILGQDIYQAKLNSNNTEINLNGQSQGVYLYRVLTESGGLIGEGKIVVEH